MNLKLKLAIKKEWQAAKQADSDGDAASAFNHLERAHILSQRWTSMHVRTHVAMLRHGLVRRDGRELAGQLARILAAALFSRIWIPEGNTGGANVSAFQRMAVPADLASILNEIV